MRHACRHHKHHHAGTFTRPGATSHYPPDMRITPVHMALELHVDIAGRSLSGTNTLRVRGMGSGGSELVLHAVDFESCEVQTPGVSGVYDGQTLRLLWDEPIGPNEERDVCVAYEVLNPVTGLFFSQPTDALPDAAWYAATDNETERARHWLPCVDLPAVRPTLEFAINAEQRFTILANGERVDDTAHADGTHTVRWRLEQPCPSYLTCIAVGEFVAYEDDNFEDIPVAYYATPPLTPEDLKRSFGRTGEMLSWMTDKLAVAFPFPKYFQFALPGFGGAMENISLVSWDDQFVMDASLATELTRLVDQVNVHEMAHSYFGDLVVCRDFAHVWLKESWATYMEQCWFEDRAAPGEWEYEFYLNAKAYFFEADRHYKRPIVTREYNSSWQMYDRHLYPGGACRLHVLRKHVGDDAFWRGVQQYLVDNAGHTVETDHFRHAIEEASGRSLGAFFDQWFHSKGYPIIDASFSWNASLKQGVFTIEQKQVDEKADVGLFTFDLQLSWVSDGQTNTRTVRVENSKHSFAVPMEADPEQVRINENNDMLMHLNFNPGDDKLLRQLTDAPDVVGRILAANELVATGRRRNVEAVGRACSAEPFWGVRAEAARALGLATSQAAVDVLVAALEEEEDPRVLHKLYTQLGNVRDPRITEGLQRKLDAGLPHRAQQAAYEALGSQRDAAPLDRLLQASHEAGFGGIAQRGALNGLARTRSDEARERLREATVLGTIDERARAHAVSALGGISRYLEARSADREAIAERLVDLLRDPNPRVQFAAAHALGAMHANGAIAALEAFAATVSAQDSVNIMRVVDGLRGAADKKAKAVGDDIADLREQVRKLKDVVEAMEARMDAVHEAQLAETKAETEHPSHPPEGADPE